MDIEKLRRQHGELLLAIGGLRELVQAGAREHATAIHDQLVAISSAIKLHLAVEDRVLYPAMEHAADSDVARTSRQFREEMGGLAAAYAAFAGRWSLSTRIAQDPQGFRDDANAVFKALHQRIQRENKELYPLAERV
ncbi:hemerythrin domain-containing protein [Dyella agri]|uniref:Hemerythrin domain-containing protein n=1 Tax=Dyella agri TaxID=1926869 RepID=A0ABW8KE41_9GAMM